MCLLMSDVSLFIVLWRVPHVGCQNLRNRPDFSQIMPIGTDSGWAVHPLRAALGQYPCHRADAERVLSKSAVEPTSR